MRIHPRNNAANPVIEILEAKAALSNIAFSMREPDVVGVVHAGICVGGFDMRAPPLSVFKQLEVKVIPTDDASCGVRLKGVKPGFKILKNFWWGRGRVTHLVHVKG